MSKKKRKNYLSEKRQRLNELQREARVYEKEIIASCSHQDDRGNFTIFPIGGLGGGGNLFQCEECDEKFSMDIVSGKDLQAAINTLHNVNNQIRIMADTRNPKDIAMSKTIGILNFDIKEIREMYDRTVRQKGKDKSKRDRRKKRHDNYDDGFGRYSDSLSFMRNGGGGKKKKNKYDGGKQYRYY